MARKATAAEKPDPAVEHIDEAVRKMAASSEEGQILALRRPMSPHRMAALAALKEEISALTDDKEVVRDTLQGEFDFDDLFDFLLRDIKYNEALISGVADEIDDLKARAARLKGRTERSRSMLEKALLEAQEMSVERPLATVFLSKKGAQLEIEAEDKIPAKYWKEPPLELSRTDLIKDLKAGKQIPGVRFDIPNEFKLNIKKR